MRFLRAVWSVLAPLLRGLLVGTGFAVGFLVVVGACWPTVYASTRQRGEARLRAARVPVAAVELAGIVRREREHGDVYFGSLTNHGNRVARRIQLEARLRHGDEVVDTCHGFEDAVEPGETRYFQIHCGSQSAPLPAHDGFDVVVTSTDWPPLD